MATATHHERLAVDAHPPGEPGQGNLAGRAVAFNVQFDVGLGFVFEAVNPRFDIDGLIELEGELIEQVPEQTFEAWATQETGVGEGTHFTAPGHLGGVIFVERQPDGIFEIGCPQGAETLGIDGGVDVFAFVPQVLAGRFVDAIQIFAEVVGGAFGDEFPR